VLEREPTREFSISPAIQFINQFILAVETGDMHQFRYRYRHVDLLVIDDIHFLAGRDRTQEEFFHTFNTLYQQQKQIILSADCPPSEIPELEERLVSRFNWGLVARIEKPCYETRVAILQKKAKMRGLSCPTTSSATSPPRSRTTPASWKGPSPSSRAWHAPGAGSTWNWPRPPSAKPPLPTARITIQQIFDAVTKYYNVRLSDLQSKKRHKSIAFPRQVCMFLARRHTRYSLEEIGGYFGGRDHTTVLHAVRTFRSAAPLAARFP
jgi:chromosomal replication initiator protein